MVLGARPVIDVMTRLKVHHMCESGAKQAAIAEKCSISLRSVERILTEEAPTVGEVAAEVRASAPTWRLDLPRHDSRWEQTPFEGSLDEVVESAISIGRLDDSGPPPHGNWRDTSDPSH